MSGSSVAFASVREMVFALPATHWIALAKDDEGTSCIHCRYTRAQLLNSVPYRGRMTMLEVSLTQDHLVSVHFRNKFYIDVPHDLDEDIRDVLIEDALRIWLKKRAREDVRSFVDQYIAQTGLKPRSVIVKDQRRHWGLCGKDGRLYLNWNLIFAPKPVLEYAVVHEMCHLRYDDHGSEFWGLVEAILPDYAKRKTWLDQNEHMLSLNLSSLMA